MIESVVYEQIIADVLDTISEMREAGGYDDETLAALEWKLSPVEEVV